MIFSGSTLWLPTAYLFSDNHLENSWKQLHKTFFWIDFEWRSNGRLNLLIQFGDKMTFRHRKFYTQFHKQINFLTYRDIKQNFFCSVMAPTLLSKYLSVTDCQWLKLQRMSTCKNSPLFSIHDCFFVHSFPHSLRLCASRHSTTHMWNMFWVNDFMCMCVKWKNLKSFCYYWIQTWFQIFKYYLNLNWNCCAIGMEDFELILSFRWIDRESAFELMTSIYSTFFSNWQLNIFRERRTQISAKCLRVCCFLVPVWNGPSQWRLHFNSSRNTVYELNVLRNLNWRVFNCN